MQDVLGDLLHERPRFHEAGTVTYTLGAQPLRALNELLHARTATLETGAGDLPDPIP
jgi:hypothetical protein